MKINLKKNQESKIVLINPKNLEIKLNENSKLTIYLYFKNSKIKKQIIQEKGSKLVCYEILKNSSIETNVQLNGKASTYTNKSLSLTTKDTTVNTIVNHNSKETKSSILNKCLIGKNSLVKCQGKIFIPKESTNSESQQKSEAILLDTTSKCEASPILEIFNDQVSCSHSASITYINPEKLYYLNSRGLNDKKATELLLEAFAQTILAEMPEEIAKEVLK